MTETETETETMYSECSKCGERVHSDEDSWYDHERYDCPRVVEHVPGGLLDELRQAEQQLGTE